jgi:hypothetical protein
MCRIRLFTFALLLLTSFGLLLSLTDSLATAQGENLLVNPSFEGAYSAYTPETAQEQADCPVGVCSTAQVPNGWKPWWIKERPTDVNPEYKPAEFSNRIRSGSRAAQYFSFWSTHKSGLRQTVTVPENAEVEFSVWGFAWISEADDSSVSDYSGTPNLRVGIDPTGGTSPYGPAVVWSDVRQVYDAYALFTVRAQAQGTQVTVFTYSAPDVNPASPDYGFKHNDIYWDDASLTVVGQGAPAPVPPPADGGGAAAPAPAQPQFVLGPTPTPDADGVIYVIVQPGDSLWSIAARAGLTLDEILELNNLTRESFINTGDRLIIGYGDPPVTEAEAAEAAAEAELAAAEPTATPQPTPTPEPTPEPLPEAAICLTAFDDANQNSQFDASEQLRAAVAFTISDDQSVVSNYVTDGASEPFCIKGLPAGSYNITRSSLASEVLTTAADFSLDLAEGQTIELAFGSYMDSAVAVAQARVGDTADTAAQTASNAALAGTAADDGSSGGMGVILVLAVVVAVLLLVGVLVIILSSRRSTV